MKTRSKAARVLITLFQILALALLPTGAGYLTSELLED